VSSWIVVSRCSQASRTNGVAIDSGTKRLKATRLDKSNADTPIAFQS
jgi:hypothetical protein